MKLPQMRCPAFPRVSHWLSGSKSVVDRKWRNAYFLGQLEATIKLAFVFYSNRVPPVVDLLRSRHPSAVFLAVSLVVVNSIQLQSILMGWKHVLGKISKVHPSFANRNPATLVPHSGMVAGIVAASLHCLPCCVKFRVAHPVLALVSSLSFDSLSHCELLGFYLVSAHFTTEYRAMGAITFAS